MYSFEDFWVDFDKKVGKDKCLTKWMLLTPEEHFKIKIHVPGFVSRKRNKQFRPNPLSYLNQKMWLDESIGETEEKQVYREVPDKSVSEEPAKYFNPEDGKDFIVGKVQAAYEIGSVLNDVGDVYTNRLKPFLNTPHEVLSAIRRQINEKALEIPKNRFEERVEISVELEIRNRILKYNIDRWRSENRKIYLEL